MHTKRRKLARPHVGQKVKRSDDGVITEGVITYVSGVFYTVTYDDGTNGLIYY